jgi:hypothetical protein
MAIAPYITQTNSIHIGTLYFHRDISILSYHARVVFHVGSSYRALPPPKSVLCLPDPSCGSGSVVGIATGYVLDSRCIESRWG